MLISEQDSNFTFFYFSFNSKEYSSLIRELFSSSSSFYKSSSSSAPSSSIEFWKSSYKIELLFLLKLDSFVTDLFLLNNPGIFFYYVYL